MEHSLSLEALRTGVGDGDTEYKKLRLEGQPKARQQKALCAKLTLVWSFCKT